ncbi:MAG: hypothetical protein IKJ99_09680 [Oscillospiraceae bacterium]|nr:hypothetical protein [Oscillospiraceae bacterium]
MKLSIKPQLLKLFSLTAGILGLLLYKVLYTTGMDEKGLLIAGHWAGVSLTALTAVILAAVILLTRSVSGADDYRGAHPASTPSGIGCFALAAALGMTVWQNRSFDTTLDMLMAVLMIAAAAGQVYVGICRLAGAKPLFLGNAALCACLAIRMVWQYQFWSSDPQLMDYVFFLGAYAALMLTAYQQAAFDADMGSHRVLWATSLAAVYLCFAALGGAADIPVLLTGGIWALTNLTSLKEKPQEEV